MKLRRLAELAALVALNRDHVIASDALNADDCLPKYLQAARVRNAEWRERLARFRKGAAPAQAASRDLLPFAAEVFVGEMLTRTWTAVLSASDRRAGRSFACPIARHVLIGVLEVRLRLLEHLLSCTAPLGTLLQTDRFRRKSERWIDLLIGVLARQDDVLEFAIDPVRAAEFRREGLSRPQVVEVGAWRLLTAGIQQSVPDLSLQGRSACSHADIAEAIRSTLPGTAKSPNVATPTLNRAPASREAATTEPTPLSPDRFPSPTSQPRTTALSFHELLRRISSGGGEPGGGRCWN